MERDLHQLVIMDDAIVLFTVSRHERIMQTAIVTMRMMMHECMNYTDHVVNHIVSSLYTTRRSLIYINRNTTRAELIFVFVFLTGIHFSICVGNQKDWIEQMIKGLMG